MKKALTLLLSLSLLIGCLAPTAFAGDASLVGGDLVLGINGTPYSLDAWSSNDLNSALLADVLYPAMVKYDADAKKVPYILESVTVNEDATVWTAKLHDGLYWHDGVKMTAEDLAFTALYCGEQSHNVNFGYDYYFMVKEAVALDELTVQYTLDDSYVNFINNCGYWVDVMPKHLFEGVEDFSTFEIPNIGFGPYKLVDHVDGEDYTFERVENYPLANDGVGAYAQTLTYRIFADVNALTLALMSGEIDATASPLPVSAQDQLRAQGDAFGMIEVGSLGYGYFSFSYMNPLLADKAVRTAIAHTVDRDALVNVAIQGGGVVMNTPVSPVYEDLVQGAATFPAFDLATANTLLEEAGYTDSDGDGIRENANGDKLSFELTCRNNTPNVDAITNIFKANCAEAGVEIIINIADPPTYTDKVTKNKDYDINYIEWGVIDDPDTTLDAIYLSSSTLNFMQFKNDEMDALLMGAKYMINYDERIQQLLEFQKLFVEELPSVNVLVRMNCYGYSNAKWEGFAGTPGLYGLADSKDIGSVHLKQ